MTFTICVISSLSMFICTHHRVVIKLKLISQNKHGKIVGKCRKSVSVIVYNSSLSFNLSNDEKSTIINNFTARLLARWSNYGNCLSSVLVFLLFLAVLPRVLFLANFSAPVCRRGKGLIFLWTTPVWHTKFVSKFVWHHTFNIFALNLAFFLFLSFIILSFHEFPLPISYISCLPFKTNEFFRLY